MSKADDDVVLEQPANVSADEELQQDAPQADADPEADASTADDEDGVTITIGEDSPPPEEEQAAPEWVRSLRKERQDLLRENRELKQQAEISRQPAPTVVLGPKPTLEASDYDAEKFERDLEAWHERKRLVDTEEATKRSAAQTAKAAWDAQLERHSKLKSELKVNDFDEADAVIESTFSVTQRGLIVHGADNSAVVFYALAKNPKKAKELSSITDPVKFAFAVAKLETQLKVTPRRAPLPERNVRGSGAAAGAGDRELERLRAEADKTGDRTKVAAHIRKQNEARSRK